MKQRETYRGVDGVEYVKLKPPAKITVTRAEGPTALCGVQRIFSDYAQANTFLREQSLIAPTDGSYHKFDFKIEFADGEEYTGRYDLRHYGHQTECCDLPRHCRDHLKWLAGNRGAVWVAGRGEIENAKKALETLDFWQPPIPAVNTIDKMSVDKLEYAAEITRTVGGEGLVALYGGYIRAAKVMYEEEGEIEIDDMAIVSLGDDRGAYVQAWLWVPEDEVKNAE